MSLIKFYVLVLIFGKVAAVTGPIEDHDVCKNQAQARYEQIIQTASQKGITSIQIEGRTATKNDLAVVCKVSVTEPKIAIDLSKIQK